MREVLALMVQQGAADELLDLAVRDPGSIGHLLSCIHLRYLELLRSAYPPPPPPTALDRLRARVAVLAQSKPCGSEA